MSSAKQINFIFIFPIFFLDIDFGACDNKNMHKNKSQRGALMICHYCQRDFAPRQKTQKYCCTECSTAHSHKSAYHRAIYGCKIPREWRECVVCGELYPFYNMSINYGEVCSKFSGKDCGKKVQAAAKTATAGKRYGQPRQERNPLCSTYCTQDIEGWSRQCMNYSNCLELNFSKTNKGGCYKSPVTSDDYRIAGLIVRRST